MKTRKYLNQTQQSQNLDSFLDVLTNTVGVLVFICLFVYLVTAQATTTIRTPVVTKSEKKARFFEVRNQRVNYLYDEEIDRQLKNLVSSLPTCYKPDIPDHISLGLYDYYLDKIRDYRSCTEKKIATIENFQTTNKYYSVAIVGQSIVYEPKSSVKGETSVELSKNNSEFKKILDNINPETEFLAFIVKADSYETFRAARQEAWNRGLDVGWEPQTVDAEIAFRIFGSGGRTISIQ
ncbi:hypothetical protein Xen7305DRAFT_00005730 [Xenococcus sp. PCC 7305]|uniref:hypothetical protein n=1 Tax=Xenococcus sp. PCC 7305 TaxID=102125 RepID=UPI0002AC0D6C|nr:hypothetical protein [Xenococcus sp. PCC 7305]ELS00872.1 hypothetical protein Xen7305DRAFT_00005730 [Xenococcus sp. PCC 7305]